MVLSISPGELVTKQNFRKIHPYKEGRALVKHRNGYGFIDTKGNLVIEGNYSKAADFSEGRAMVQRDNRCGFVDLSGKEIIPLIYSKCLDFEDGKAVVYEGLKKGGIINLSGEEIIEPGINRLINFKEGRGLVRKNYQFYYIAEDASWRDGYFEKAAHYQHGIAVVKKEGKWGIINRNGLHLISNKYDKIDVFNNGFAKVQLGKFRGLANLKGSLLFHQFMNLSTMRVMICLELKMVEKLVICGKMAFGYGNCKNRWRLITPLFASSTY